MRVQVEVHLEGYFEGPSAVQVELEGQFGEPSGVQVALGGQFERPSGVQVALGGQFEGPSGVQVALGGHLEGPREIQVALGGHSDGVQVRLGWPKSTHCKLNYLLLTTSRSRRPAWRAKWSPRGPQVALSLFEVGPIRKIGYRKRRYDSNIVI